MFLCREITYSDIKPYWDQLWPGREYEPHSAMAYLGGYLAWPPKEVCWYAIVNDQNVIVGVNSCHDTGHLLVRSRGLWVDPQYRGQGLGQQLLNYAVDWARARNYYALWSNPKQSAWPTYEAVGFKQEGAWYRDGNSVNSYAINYL